jgi:allantoin racemase
MTDLVQRNVIQALSAMRSFQKDGHIRCIPETANFGNAYISDEQGYAVAVHAVLEKSLQLLKQQQNNNDHQGSTKNRKPVVDMILIYCFGDPGMFAVREASLDISQKHRFGAAVPAIGLLEASIIHAIDKLK